MTNTTEVSESNVVQFQDPDEVIPLVSGFPLIDADAKVLARRLRKYDWENRARIFNNFVTDSLATLPKAGEIVAGDEDKEKLSAWVLAGMAERIGQCLGIWGAERPTNGPMAVLYNLSLHPLHRRAARGFFSNDEGSYEKAGAKHTRGRYESLFVMHRLVLCTQPGLTLAYYSGIPDDPDITLVEKPKH